MMQQICPDNLCYGCEACAGACPVEAITMEPLELGHLHPHIDNRKCIDCKLCERICPTNSLPGLNLPKKTFAAWAIDNVQHTTSTSGGISACLTDYILENGGVVYGCAALPGGKIEHIRIAEQTDASKIKGSKYVQSSIPRHIYQSIKSDLKSKTVLFLGTPCQVAAVKSLFAHNDVNLIGVDLICHGVPSQELLFSHLKSYGIQKSKIEKIGFRDKEGYNLSVICEDKNYRIPETRDLYYMAFNENIAFRDSCYSCCFSCDKRVGDLTIGDFWGLGSTIPFNYSAGGNISVILANSEKGQSIIEDLSQRGVIKAIERPLEEAVKGNHNLRKPSFSIIHDKFKECYNPLQIEQILRKLLWKRRIKGYFIPIIQWALKQLSRIRK